MIRQLLSRRSPAPAESEFALEKTLRARRSSIEILEARIAPAAALTVTKIDAFLDADGDGKAEPGQTIHYTVTVTNSGDVDLTGVTFDDLLDPNTTLIGTSVNVSPLAINDTYSAVANTQLRVGTVPGFSGAFAANATGVTANDAEFLGDTFTILSFTSATTSGGSVTMITTGPDAGSFVYVPAANFTGADTFTYTLTDDGIDGIAGNADDLTSVASVTINVGAQKVWYVDSSYAGANGASDGRSTRPFTTLAQVSGATGPDAAGDIIYLHTGTGSYTGGVTLLNSQQLIGQAEALIVGGFTLQAAGADPVVTNAAGSGVTLASGNTLRGFTVGNTSAFDIRNTPTASVGTLTISNVILNGTGGLLAIDSGGTISISLDSASTTSASAGGLFLSGVSGAFSVAGATSLAGITGDAIHVVGNSSATVGFQALTISGTSGRGIVLAGHTGAFSATSGSITTTAENDVEITGGTGAVTLPLNITNTAGRSISIDNHETGNVTFSGTISDTGAGILVQNVNSGTIAFTSGTKTLNTGVNNAVTLINNSGATINFSNGGLDIDTTSGIGFTATGGGTITITTGASSNTIDATSGAGLNVNATTIGGSGLTFQRISSGPGANNGISLVNTGAGGLLVTGLDGADAGTDPDLGSGGVISGKTGADGSTTSGTGIFLSNANNVSLNGMTITNHQNYGIRGNEVDGFRLTFSLVGGTNGTNVSSPFSEGSVSFVGTPVTGYGLRGNVAFLDNEITGGAQRNVSIDNATGTLNLNFLRNNVHHTGATFGDDGLAIEVDTNAVLFANVSNNIFSAHGGDHFNLSLVNNASADLTFKNNDMQGGHAVGLGQGVFILGASFNGTLKYDISNNGTIADPFTGNKQGGAIFVNKGSGTGTFSGQITNNVIGDSAVPLSGSEQAVGIHASARGAGGSHTVLISGNTVRQYNDRGIVIEAGEGSPTLVATVVNNTVSHPGSAVNSLHGIHFDFGILSGDNAQITIDVRGNLIATAGNEAQGGVDFRMRTAGSNDVFIAGYSGGNSSANAQAFIDGLNPDGTSFSVSQAGSGTYNNGPASPLPAPNLPTLPPAPLLFDPLLQNPDVTQVDEGDGDGNIFVPPADVDNNDTVAPPELVDDGVLSDDELNFLVHAAVARWVATGLTAQQIALLESVTFTIADLPGWYLGQASGLQITLDANAAGNQWFVDPTPMDDAEFSGSGSRLAAITGGGAFGRVDALTTILHELGHALGLEDGYASGDRDNLMFGWIGQSERRLPIEGQAEGADPSAHGDEGPAFVFNQITIGNLPVGKSVTIVFDATVNSNITAGQVQNQATVTSTQTGAVLSDDPSVVGSANPTVTLIDLPDATVAVSGANVAEDGPATLAYTFALDFARTFDVAVNFTASGTAAAASDFTLAGTGVTFNPATGLGTIIIPAGMTSATATLNPTDDTTVELDESVTLTVTAGSTGYEVGTPAAATATILNDDTDVSVSVAPASVAEDGAGNLVYTFTRAGLISGAHTVNFSVTGSPTLTSADYSVLAAAGITFDAGSGTGTVAFAGGETTKTVTIDPTADNTVEADETATVTILAGAGYNSAGTPATGTILNDDSDVTLAITPASVTEDGAGNLVYTFTRTGFTTVALTVNFTVGGAATFSTDYTQSGATTFDAATGTITFAPGVTTATVTIDPTADAVVEADEAVVLTLAAGAGYNVATAGAVTGTITNDDTDVTLSIAPASVFEDGNGTLVYTFTRTGVTSGALTVNFSVAGTAAFGTDYGQTGAATFGASAGTVTFAAGASTATLTIDPTDDATVEGDETAILTLTSGTGYTAATPASATGTILNDDTDISITVEPAAVTEDGAGNLVYTFTRTGVLTGALTVNFSVGGTATFNTDYTQTGAATFGGSAGTVTFAAGASTASITLDPTADSVIEADETAILTITAGTGYNLAASSVATGIITNDDAEVTLAVSPASVAEDAAANLVYTFTRTGFTGAALTVNFNVAGTATFGNDYTTTGSATFTATTGTVVFAAGSNTATVIVDPSSDATGEPDETVALTLGAGAGYAIANPDTATGTILNDDTAVSVAVSPANALESAGTPLVYTFTRTGDTTTALTVNFNYAGTATSGADYAQTGAATFAGGVGTIVIPVGQASATVNLAVQNDTLVEGSETAILTVAAGSGYSPGGNTVATGTIDDNDTAVLRFTAGVGSVNEGAGTRDVTVELLITADGVAGTGTLATPVSVDLSALGTSTAGAGDFTFASPQTITFNAGQATTTTNVPIAITNDASVEGTETIEFTLGNLTHTTGSQVSLNGPTDHTLTIVDNDTATIGLVSGTSTTAEDGTPSVQVGLVITADGTGVPMLERSVSLTIGATGGTAIGGGTDYTFATPQTITFAAGATAGTQTVAVTLNNDTIVEGSETIVFGASNLVDGTAGQVSQSGPAQHTVTITDNDTATLQFALSTSATSEGSGGHTFDATLVITANGVAGTGSLAGALTFEVTELAGDTATLDADYTLATHSFTYAAGSASGALPVAMVTTDDTLLEGAETAAFGVEITTDPSGGQVSLGAQSTHTVTIGDNETATVSLVSGASSANEADGTGNVGISLMIIANGVPNSGTLARNVSIDLQDLLSGTALPGGSDYTFASPQTVTFASGASSSIQNVSVAIVNDTRLEGAETIVLRAGNLVDGTNGAVSFTGATDHTLTIIDNESATLQFAAASASISETGGALPVGLTLVITANGQVNTGTLDRAISVDLTDVLPRTATPGGVDYSFASPQTITFAVGESGSTKNAILTVIDDALSESNESLTLQLGGLADPSGQASLGAIVSSTVTIVDDDVDLAVTTTESANVIVAGGGNNLTYTITVSNAGATDATGVVISEDLQFPPGVSVLSVTPTLGSFATTADPDGNWTITTLAAGSSASLTIVIAVDASAPEGADLISSTAVFISSNENRVQTGDDFSTETTSIDRQVDLQITKTDNATNAAPGDTVSYVLNFANNGPSNATGVVVTEVLPAGMTFNAAASIGTWIEGPAGVFTLNVGTLAPTASGGATFAVIVDNPAAAGVDEITNTATIADDGTAGADLNLANNAASDTNVLDASPDLRVSVIDDPLVAQRGGTVRYVISYSNAGDQDATGVFLTMTLPENTSFDFFNSTGIWTPVGGNVFQIDLGNVAAGAAAGTVTFAVEVNAVLPGGYTVLSTVATLDDDHANGADPNVADNTATETTPIYQGIYAVAPGVALPRKGAPPVVRVFDIATGTQIHSIQAYDPSYRDSIRIAVGDINGDGFDDIITSTRKSNGQVRVFDGVTGARFEGVFAEIAAFTEKGAKGAFVASGDVTGDGRDDIIVGSGQGARGSGKVRVFDGVTGSLVSTSEPFAPSFRGGVRVAVGDVNGDGVADIVASQGFRGNDVVVTSGISAEVLHRIEVGGPRFRGGVFVATGDLDGDGRADIIIGRDRGKTLVETFDGATGAAIDSFAPFRPNYRLGARVAVADVNLDGLLDIILGAGGRGNSEVKIFSGLDKSVLNSFQAFPSHPTGSLFVAGTNPVPALQPILQPA